MPEPGDALQKLGFLTIGLFDGHNPGPGHEVTLEMISLGERLGYDSAWVRHRHLQFGISRRSPCSRRRRSARRGSSSAPLALPFTFEWDDYAQILADIAEKLGPALGWQPRSWLPEVRGCRGCSLSTTRPRPRCGRCSNPSWRARVTRS